MVVDELVPDQDLEGINTHIADMSQYLNRLGGVKPSRGGVDHDELRISDGGNAVFSAPAGCQLG